MVKVPNFKIKKINISNRKPKFGPIVKFNRIKNFEFNGLHYRIYINKNDSVYDVKLSEVTEWKTLKNNKSIPAAYKETRDTYLFNRVYGNPTKIAINKIMAELEYKMN